MEICIRPRGPFFGVFSSSSVCVEIPEAQKDIKKMDEVGKFGNFMGNQPGGHVKLIHHREAATDLIPSVPHNVGV